MDDKDDELNIIQINEKKSDACSRQDRYRKKDQLRRVNIKYLKQKTKISNEKRYNYDVIFYGKQRFRFSLLHASVDFPCRIPVLSRKFFDKPVNCFRNVRPMRKSRIPVRIKGYVWNNSEKLISTAVKKKSDRRSMIPVRITTDRNVNTNAKHHNCFWGSHKQQTGREMETEKKEKEKSRLFKDKIKPRVSGFDNANVKRPDVLWEGHEQQTWREMESEKKEKNRFSKSKIPLRVHGYVWNTTADNMCIEKQKENEIRRMLAPLTKIPIAMERLRNNPNGNLGLGRTRLPPICIKCKNVENQVAKSQDNFCLPILPLNSNKVTHSTTEIIKFPSLLSSLPPINTMGGLQETSSSHFGIGTLNNYHDGDLPAAWDNQSFPFETKCSESEESDTYVSARSASSSPSFYSLSPFQAP